MTPSPSYQSRLAAEQAIFENQLQVHDLPKIHHYWANRHLRPQLETFGFRSPDDFFYKTLQRQIASHHGPLHFLSLGSGNCDTELAIAKQLHDGSGCPFVIECLDLNPAMLDRGRENASLAGLAGNFEFQMADFNSWEPHRQYDAVIANQALHHVVNLEHLLEATREGLAPGAPFVISDMIGRNGHQRWPEARAIVDEFWRRLPPSCRFNRALNRFEECFEDRDCSTEGFEGIRSQDILPLLTGLFHFEFFLGFGNVIDPFIDRQFGYNFDATEPWIRRFIDEVHHRDEQEQLAGRITPTHMLAVATVEPTARKASFFPRSAADCVRDPDKTAINAASPPAACGYDFADWSHKAPEELTSLSQHFTVSQQKVKELEQWGEGLNQELAERTAWALQLDREMTERTAWALRLDKELAEQNVLAAAERRTLEQELEERTRWAMDLNQRVRTLEADLTAQVGRGCHLEKELEGRTTWAQSLEKQAVERTEWALRLQAELVAERQASSQLVYLSPRMRRLYQAANAFFKPWQRK